MLEEFLRTKIDVLEDLAKKSWGDVASTVNRNRRSTAIGMPKLLMGPSLPDLLESEGSKSLDHLARLEDGELSHTQAEMV